MTHLNSYRFCAVKQFAILRGSLSARVHLHEQKIDFRQANGCPCVWPGRYLWQVDAPCLDGADE